MGGGTVISPSLLHDLQETVASHFKVDSDSLNRNTRFVEDLHADEHDMEELRISLENRLSKLHGGKQVLFHDDFNVAAFGELLARVERGRFI